MLPMQSLTEEIFNLFQVKASVAIVEAHFVLKGILDFVNKHNIRKLIIGAIPE